MSIEKVFATSLTHREYLQLHGRWKRITGRRGGDGGHYVEDECPKRKLEQRDRQRADYAELTTFLQNKHSA